MGRLEAVLSLSPDHFNAILPDLFYNTLSLQKGKRLESLVCPLHSNPWFNTMITITQFSLKEHPDHEGEY